MKKDFGNWHNKKDKLENIEKRPFFKEREIWFCYLGLNIGDEEDGKRLGYKIGEISKNDFSELKRKLKKLLP